MRRYLLDTGILLPYSKGRAGAVTLVAPWLSQQEATTSILVYGEIIEYLKSQTDFRRRSGNLRALMRNRMLTQGVICPRCGRGTLFPQVVVETIAVGSDAVQVATGADVCSFCSERWFDPQATAIIDEAMKRLRDGDTSHLTHIGELYRAS